MADNHMKTGGEQQEFKQKVSTCLDVHPDIATAFEELKIRRKHRYMIIKIGESHIELEKCGDRNETFAQFQAGLPYTDCRFALFDNDKVCGERNVTTNRIHFICWFPNNSNTYNKMAYSSEKSKLLSTFTGVFEVSVRSADELKSALGLGTAEEEEESDSDIDI